MSASNYSWVCFKCRLVVRQAKTAKHAPACNGCGAECFCLGYKVEVPTKQNLRGWRKLHEDCRERAAVSSNAKSIERTRAIHGAERRVAQLLALPANKERAKLIAELKETIALQRPKARRTSI